MMRSRRRARPSMRSCAGPDLRPRLWPHPGPRKPLPINVAGFRPDRWRGADRPVIGLPGPLSHPAARAIMAKISFVDHSGETRTIDVENGATVMEAAIRNAIPGIEAECGGACACATCHVYVDEAWREKTGDPSPMEEDMLDFAFDVRPSSRLSCQIKVTEELDGLVVTVPPRQA